MLRDIPLQFWLLVMAGIAAIAPAQYLYKYVRHSPARRDIMQPAEDLEWRNTKDLTRNAAILAALTAFSIFIWTPAAAHMTQQPTFVPIMLSLFGGWCLYSVIQGLITGRIRPFVNGVSDDFDRGTKPKRFWLSLCWNAMLGGFMLFFGIKMIEDAPLQALKDACYLNNEKLEAKAIIAACDKLIAEPEKLDGELDYWLENRGIAYLDNYKYKQAIVDFDASIKLDPDDATVFYNRGLAYDRLDKLDLAIADYTTAISKNPENANYYLNRGNVLIDQGKHTEAIADFDRALKLAPKNHMALADRGIAYAWKGDRANAERDLAAADAINPNSAVVLRGKVIVSLPDQDADATLALLTNVLNRYPDDRWSLYARAGLYRAMGEDEKARADEERLARARAAEGV